MSDSILASRPDQTDRYDVYAVLYGRRVGLHGEHFHTTDARVREPHPTAYFFWLVVGRDRVVLVDTGMARSRADSLSGLEFYGEAPDLLAQLGWTSGTSTPSF